MTHEQLARLDELPFSTNWNNKLSCNCFTTLRLQNTKKYYVGKQFKISLQGKLIKVARVFEIKKLEFEQLNEFTCHIDTGYSLAETKGILEKMYTRETLERTGLMLILLVTEKIALEPMNTEPARTEASKKK